MLYTAFLIKFVCSASTKADSGTHRALFYRSYAGLTLLDFCTHLLLRHDDSLSAEAQKVVMLVGRVQFIKSGYSSKLELNQPPPKGGIRAEIGCREIAI
jgi:hypothetical protein